MPPFDPPLADDERDDAFVPPRAEERADVFAADERDEDLDPPDFDPPDFEADRDPDDLLAPDFAADFLAPDLPDDLAADFLAPDFADDVFAPDLADDLAADFLAPDFADDVFAPDLAEDLAEDLADDLAPDFFAPDFAEDLAAVFLAPDFAAPDFDEPDFVELLLDELPVDFAAVFFEDEAALFFAPDFAGAFLPLEEPLFAPLFFAEDEPDPLVLPAPLVLISLVLDLSSVGIAASFKDLHVQPSRLHKATSLYQASSGSRKVSEVERVRFLWILLFRAPSALASTERKDLPESTCAMVMESAATRSTGVAKT